VLSDRDQDEAIAWPSYVDFMSTFVFVLIIFVGALLYIMSGDIGNRTFRQSVSTTQEALRSAEIKNWVEGKKLYISLKGQVRFEPGCPDPARTSCKSNGDLSQANQANLRKVAKIIASQQGWNRIVIEGRADATPYRDPQTGKITEDSAFRNFDLSSRRAMQVLKFFHECPGCDKSYDLNVIRPKLALSGLGSKTDSGEKDGDNQDERRVDVVLDYSEGLK
jgi:hypothetical protein